MSTQTLGDFGVICKEMYVFYRHFADFLMTFLKILKNSLIRFSFSMRNIHTESKSHYGMCIPLYSQNECGRIWLFLFLSNSAR